MSKKKEDPSFSNDGQQIPPNSIMPQQVPTQQPMQQWPTQQSMPIPQQPMQQWPTQQSMPIPQQPMQQWPTQQSMPIPQQPMPEVPIPPQPPLDPYPQQYGETINPQKLTTENALPKKIAAQEYVRNLKNLKALSIITIASPLIIMTLTTYDLIVGGVGSLIQVALGAYFLYKSQKEIKYLETKYHL